MAILHSDWVHLHSYTGIITTCMVSFCLSRTPSSPLWKIISFSWKRTSMFIIQLKDRSTPPIYLCLLHLFCSTKSQACEDWAEPGNSACSENVRIRLLYITKFMRIKTISWSTLYFVCCQWSSVFKGACSGKTVMKNRVLSEIRAGTKTPSKCTFWNIALRKVCVFEIRYVHYKRHWYLCWKVSLYYTHYLQNTDKFLSSPPPFSDNFITTFFISHYNSLLYFFSSLLLYRAVL